MEFTTNNDSSTGSNNGVDMMIGDQQISNSNEVPLIVLHEDEEVDVDEIVSVNFAASATVAGNTDTDIHDSTIDSTIKPKIPVTAFTNTSSIDDVVSTDDFDDVATPTTLATTNTDAAAITSTLKTVLDIATMNSFDSITNIPENHNNNNIHNDNNIDTSTTTGSTVGIQNLNETETDINSINNSDKKNNETTTTAVTSERKEQLLLQARFDRIQWIHQIPLPYMKKKKPKEEEQQQQQQQPQHHLTSPSGTTITATANNMSHAIYHLPTLPSIVQYLYGPSLSMLDVDAYITDQFQQQQQQQLTNETSNIDHPQQRHPNPNIYRMTGTQIMEAELQQLTARNSISNDNDDNDKATIKLILLQYQKFIHILEDPTTATIVQKLRSFIRQLYKKNNATITSPLLSRDENNNSNGNTNNNNGNDESSVSMIVSKFQSYIYSIYDNTILNHPLFIEMITTTISDNNFNNQNDNETNNNELLRRSYDSFVYGHCYSYFQSVFLYNNDLHNKSQQFYTNVQFLSSFVTPIHLEINCFVTLLQQQSSSNESNHDNDGGESVDNSSNKNEVYVNELLSKSVQILQSIDTYYSPYEKLQRILMLYHEINIALKCAIAKSTNSTTNKLPSADDILPTFIYVILLASSSSSSSSLEQHDPLNIFYNLYYIEQLLTASSYKSSETNMNNRHRGSSSSNSNSNHHYLRGEAGYAYTNLYSAYQFISEFDTSNVVNPFGNISSTSNKAVSDDKTTPPPPPPTSLSISKAAWNTAIESYKSKAQEQYEAIQKKASFASKTLRIDSYEPNLSIGINLLTDLQLDNPVLHAPTPMEIRQARQRGEMIDLNWALQRQQQKVEQQLVSDQQQQQRPINRTPKSVFEQVEENLPHGFQRNYKFLNARTVDDLKYNDVEHLLQEYHTLVRTTETLLSERAKQITRERKVQQIQKEKALLEQEQQVLMLLDNNNGTDQNVM